MNGITARLRGPALVGLLAILVASCSGESTSSPEAPESVSVPPSPATESPLVGTWRTAPLSQSDAEATLEREGLGEFTEAFSSVLSFDEGTRLRLDLEATSPLGGTWNLYGEPKGAEPYKIDFDAEYEIDGDTVDKIHATGITTFRWVVTGDTLTLEFLDNTEPDFEGIPDEVFQHALYMTEEFQGVSSS